VTDGSQPSYDLMLTGTFQYANMNLAFSLDFKDTNGLDLSVSVGVQGDRNSLIKNLALVLDITESQASLQLNLQFTVRLSFVDGIRVKTPVAAPAPAPIAPAPAQAAIAPAPAVPAPAVPAAPQED
jgi:hypothetical protein